MADRLWPNRLRWRVRGALRGIAVVAGLIAVALLLWRLPIAGSEGPHPVTALLLAAGMLLIVLAALTRPLGRLVRRLDRTTPEVVARDRAACLLVAGVVAAVAAGGVVHRSTAADARATFEQQRDAVRAFVAEHAPADVRARVEQLDTWQLGPDVFRSCIPEPVGGRAYCVYVLTDREPPQVRSDPDRRPNADLAGPGRPVWGGG